LQRWMNRMPAPTAEEPDVFNATYITNFSSHYDGRRRQQRRRMARRLAEVRACTAQARLPTGARAGAERLRARARVRRGRHPAPLRPVDGGLAAFPRDGALRASGTLSSALRARSSGVLAGVTEYRARCGSGLGVSLARRLSASHTCQSSRPRSRSTCRPRACWARWRSWWARCQ
jgi:hypothetical protein